MVYLISLARGLARKLILAYDEDLTTRVFVDFVSLLISTDISQREREIDHDFFKAWKWCTPPLKSLTRWNFYKPQFPCSLAGVIQGHLILLVNAVFMATKLAGDVYDYRVREFERFR